MYFFSKFQQHFLQQVQLAYMLQTVQIAVSIVDSVDSFTDCKQCRQLYLLLTVQTMWIVVPIEHNVESCICCGQCRYLYLLQAVWIAVPTTDSVDECTYYRPCSRYPNFLCIHMLHNTDNSKNSRVASFPRVQRHSTMYFACTYFH